MTTSKSKLLNTAQPPSHHPLAQPLAQRRPPGARTEIAGHRDGALEPAHAFGDDDVDEDVDDGGGGESLEHLKRIFLHLSRPRGELEQAYGERHRGILDAV